MAGCKQIAFINQKGGVGKSTCALNIGTGLARLGKKVLLIDFDPQANLSIALMPSGSVVTHGVYELLQAVAQDKLDDLTQFIVPIKLSSDTQVYLVPASIALSAYENLADTSEREKNQYVFKKALEQFTGLDYIIVDCPPSLGYLTLSVLAAVHEVYVPMQTEFFALQGLAQITNVLNAVNQSINPALKLGALIGTRYNRRKLHKETVNYLKKNFGDLMLNTVVRESIALAESPSFNKDVFAYAPESPGAEDFNALCKEIIKLNELPR